ncbi:hypothetical protein Hanom_Chr11g00980001 [Helianthus anomalus]
MSSQVLDDSKTKSEEGTTGIDKKRRQRVSYDEDSISPNPTSEDNNMESFHKNRARRRRVSFADNNSGTSLSPNPQRNNEPNIASANSNHETHRQIWHGMARFPAALVSKVIRGSGNVTLSWTSHSP